MTGRLATCALLAVAVVACGRDSRRDVVQQGSAIPLPADVRPTPKLPDRFESIGHAAADAEVRAWNIDVNPRGDGLPAGHGSYATGQQLIAQKCAACHGAHGEGQAIYPRLIGAEPRDSFPFARDLKYVHTIGNYWPYATTLYDYINRAMPLTAPGSLKPDEIYSVIDYLLAENGVIGREVVMDERSLPRVAMPARNRFVRDDRVGGAIFR